MTVTVTSAPGTSPPNKYGGDPAAFDIAMQAHLTWQAATLVTELNAQNAENNALNSGINTACANAVTLATANAAASAATAANRAQDADGAAISAASSATAASTQAALAASATNAPLWVSGTTYALGAVVYSATTYRSYRRKVAGAGTTNPATDTTNWGLLTTEMYTGLPTVRPTLTLDFANSQSVDSRITTTRSTTSTRVNQFGVMETVAGNVPLIDFDPATLACNGLRMAGGVRTNYLLRSQEFDNTSVWARGPRLTITANTTETTAPDGSYTADKIVETAILDGHYFDQPALQRDPALVSTFSGYVKYAGRSNIGVTLYDWTYSTNNYISLRFNPLTGAILTAGTGGGNATVYDAFVRDAGNGWWYFEISGIPTTSTGGGTINPRLDFVNSSTTYMGDGVSGIYAWGFQVVNSYPGVPYIPTTTAQVTRSQDELAITGAKFTPWFNPSEGTFVVTFTPPKISESGSYGIVAVTDGSSSNFMDLMNNGTFQNAVVRVTVAGTPLTYLSAPPTLTQHAKNTVAFSYKLNSVNKSANGGALNIDTAALIPAVTRLDIGGAISGSVAYTGWIQRIAYYPKALPTNLQVLSS